MLIYGMIIFLLAALYLFFITPNVARKKQTLSYRGTMFAHRGYHCKEKGVPENSMAAFRAALERNYGIELDIHITKDNEVVVFHDDTLTRVCGRKGSPEKMTAAQLKACPLLGTGETIPGFQEVLSLVDGRVPLLIELKMQDRSTRLCERAYELLKSYRGPYMIQSFNTEGLHWFRTHAPHVLRGQLASNHTKFDHKPHWILRFLAKHLMLNFWGRPDFISYQLSDLPTPNTTILRMLFGTPFAVWTLRDRESLKEGVLHYDMQIFEKSYEIY